MNEAVNSGTEKFKCMVVKNRIGSKRSSYRKSLLCFSKDILIFLRISLPKFLAKSKKAAFSRKF